MADASTQQEAGPKRLAGPEPVILRDWPKIIMMWPTLLVGLICGVLMALYPISPSDERFVWNHYVGLVFRVTLAVIVTLLLY